MAEYIEREALIEVLNGLAIELLKDKSIQCSLAAGTVVDIKDNVVVKFRAADVVPVVRCGNCGYYKDGLCLTLPCNPVVRRQPNDYCSYGRIGKND